MDPVLELPDIDAALALPAAERWTVMTDAVLRTAADLDVLQSAHGRRRWFAAWRAWLDRAEVRPGVAPPELFRLVQAILDWAERELPPADQP